MPFEPQESPSVSGCSISLGVKLFIPENGVGYDFSNSFCFASFCSINHYTAASSIHFEEENTQGSEHAE
jgi:hypothetical protein